MSVPPDQFSRIAGRLNISLLATKLVVVVGVGTVGSQMTRELANNSVGHLRLIDGDYLEESNLIRHALTRPYLGMNKAEALALYLTDEVPTLQADALPRNIDESMSDEELDKLLSDADLIVAATDDRDAQRRIARRALARDIPTVLPALYGDNGGEVFVQRSSRNPCFFCWDGFRRRDERLRGVTALNADTLAVLQLAVQLSLGVLDGRSEYAEFMQNEPPDTRPLQLFIQRRHAALEMAPQPRLRDCPSCAVGPASGESSHDTGGVPIQPPITSRVQQPTIIRLPPPTTSRRVGESTPTWVIPPIWLVALVLGGIVALLALVQGGSGKNLHPPMTPQEQEAPTVAEIDKLHFECRVQYICNLAPYKAGDLPLFIKGMDSHLASELEQQGYTDFWQSIGTRGESVKTIGHGGSEETKTREYVHRASTGLLSGLRAPQIYPSPESIGRWPVTITWTLSTPSGKNIRRLSYSLHFIECSDQENATGEGYCQKVIYFVGQLQNTGNASKGIDAFSE